MTNLEDTTEQTQDTPEGLHLPAGLGEMRDPPRGAGASCWGKDHLCNSLYRNWIVLMNFYLKQVFPIMI